MSPQQFVHVSMLFNQGRYADAEAALENYLAHEPDSAMALQLIAVALHHQDREEEAMRAILMALRSDPDNVRALSWKARIHLALRQKPEAAAAAQQAISLDPHESFNWVTKALIHADQREWMNAETAARTALDIDPDDEAAHHVLSQALLYQGRSQENEANIASRLAVDPNNPIAHCNSGFASLRARDHKKASMHFAEALRIDPECQMARDGLIDSFRARSVVYRNYLAFSMRMAGYSEKYGTGLAIGIYVAYRILRGALESIDKRLSTALLFLYLTFVFWTYVARGLSTFFLLADPFARMALRTREKWEAVVVGGGFAVGFVLAIAGFLAKSPAVMITGAFALAQSIPASLFFDSDTKRANRVYGLFACVTWLGGLILLANVWVGFPSNEIVTPSVIAGSISLTLATLFAMFGFGRR